MSVTRKHITADEFRRMAEAGVFGEDERLELLGGDIIELTPISPEHARAVRKLVRWLQVSLGNEAVLDSQNPLLLPGDTELYPDVAVLRPRSDDYRDLPRAEDALLVVEVAKTSVRFDLSVKRLHYAAAGVPKYWVSDLDDSLVHCHSRPEAGDYRDVQTLAPSGALTFRGSSLSVRELF